MKTHLQLRDLVLVLLVAALWGFLFVPMKFALASLPPFLFAALRFFFAAFPLLFFVRLPQVSVWMLAAYGLAIGVGQFGLLFLGMKMGMPAGLSSLVVQVQAFFTMGLAIWLFKDRLGVHNILGAAIATAGVVLLGWHVLDNTDPLTSGSSGLIAFMVVIAAAFAWAIGNIIAKKLGKENMLGVVVWSSLAPPLPLAVLSFAFEPVAWHALTHMSAVTFGIVLLSSYGGTIFGYVIWNAMLARYPTALIAPFALLVPVTGILAAVLMLGETFAPLQTAGAVLVMAGLAINVYGRRRAPVSA